MVKPSEAQDLQRKGETVASWNSQCSDIGTFRAYISDGVKAVFTLCELKVSINQGNKKLARIVGKQASIGAQAELSNSVYESVPACE